MNVGNDVKKNSAILLAKKRVFNRFNVWSAFLIFILVLFGYAKESYLKHSIVIFWNKLDSYFKNYHLTFYRIVISNYK